MNSMQTEFILHADGESLSCLHLKAREAKGHVLLLHGAGKGNKGRYQSLMDELCDSGFDVTAFDFSGHGESSGKLSELSLKRRRYQALHVMRHVRTNDLPFIVVGFSMSGQTICDLISDPQNNIAGIALCCPAAYADNVQDLPFGASLFTETIRIPGNWKTSQSFEILRNYKGKILVVTPEVDEVIPQEVTDQILLSCPQITTEHTVVSGAPHMLGLWLSTHPVERKQVASAVVRLL
ncbi:esterase/lipase [Streptomyces aurantiacus]|uniref:alpha/beta hydrolase n=1 Tax=Streptomyces aurantiacus TaxID=47760 RepID=UPI002790025E|nr:alpha/beta fold hydrolase [Streptomyces aurantiacus]MDQ0776339.1 esterase/lipase [Streptomyces aurantiacus]